MQQDRHVAALVLAAGKGTRMKSNKPKVLHEILGQSLLWYVYQALENVVLKEHIWTVVGYASHKIAEYYPDMTRNFIYQEQQLGTGHAFQCAYQSLKEQGYTWCLVVNGDTPLITSESLVGLMEKTQRRGVDCALMSMFLDNPQGYGRIVRDEHGQFVKVIEEKDLTVKDTGASDMNEVNTGIYCVRLSHIEPFLHFLTNVNEQKEYYLPQLLEICRDQGGHVDTSTGSCADEFLGINTPKELIRCEECMQWRILNKFLENGVVMHQPSLIRVGPQVELSPGVEITGPCEIYGQSCVANGSQIASHVWMKDVNVDQGTIVSSFSHIEGARVGPKCSIGPYARLRPGTQVAEGSKVGNFVEVKKAQLDRGCKVSHLSYIGDAHIGEETNVGAGTITCNYDGTQKHQTSIGKQAFIGSNTSLVAPVSVGDYCVIGAGSTITKDVPEQMLSVARGKQKNLDWKRKWSRES
jgi:bifunctional UDP-N-acetylglucosamine pyrophosphorylase/glucosamine-1-phosphate N-acetyltransferase